MLRCCISIRIWTLLTLGSLSLQYHLRRASLTEDDAFVFLKADNDSDCISYLGFCEALRQVDSIRHSFSSQYIALFDFCKTKFHALFWYSLTWLAIVMDWVMRRYRSCGCRLTLMEMVLLTTKNSRYRVLHLFYRIFPTMSVMLFDCSMKKMSSQRNGFYTLVTVTDFSNGYGMPRGLRKESRRVMRHGMHLPVTQSRQLGSVSRTQFCSPQK